MRALLIVNPHATSTTGPRRDVIVRALSSAVDLEVVQTRYRGDATRLAASAAADNFGLVMTLGGDGTVNEAVNGLMSASAHGPAATGHTDRPGAGQAEPQAEPQADPQATARVTGHTDPQAAAQEPATALPADRHLATADELPALAALPGGNANVFTRSLRLPDDPIDAAARLIDDLANGRERRIGLGLANGRYFTFNAGLGLDAEVVRAVEGRRAHGRVLTPALFTMTALRQYYSVTDRRHPAITICAPSDLSSERVYLCIVSNSAPWTYLGRRPINTNPDAGFDTGLDLFALRSLSTPATLWILSQMLSDRATPPRSRNVVTRHDLDEIVLRAGRPVAFQVDGEYMGEAEEARFQAVPDALRVVGLPELVVKTPGAVSSAGR